MTGALAVLTGSVFLIGLFPTPLFNAIDDSTDELFSATPIETTAAEASDD